jgi:hypothetical protein
MSNSIILVLANLYVLGALVLIVLIAASKVDAVSKNGKPIGTLKTGAMICASVLLWPLYLAVGWINWNKE